MYNAMSRIEARRCESDMLYDCLTNVESEQLNSACAHIYAQLSQRWSVEEMSPRLRNTLHQSLTSEDRVAKHALLFFALYREPTTHTLFLGETPRVPPDKFGRFVEQELPAMVEKLLHGSFTSLRAFVEDTRWVYATL